MIRPLASCPAAFGSLVPRGACEDQVETVNGPSRWFFEDLPRRLEEESADKSISKEDLVQIVSFGSPARGDRLHKMLCSIRLTVP